MKTILLLGAGIEQTLAIDEAKRLGYKVIACDQNPNAKGLKIADIGVVCDINDVKQLCILGRKYNINGVFCHGVEIPEVAAKISTALNLPGITPEVAHRATNKITRLEWFKSHNIPVADFHIARNEGDIKNLQDKIKFPVILKPIDSSGARGVQVVDKKEQLIPAYNEANTYSKSQTILLESFLHGNHVSTESIIYNGKIITFAFADRNYELNAEFHPYFIEDGINYPSKLSQQQRQNILELVERTIKKLGITMGAAKGDIVIDGDQPKIIEMAARTSGGWFGAGSIPIATGTNMLRPLLQMAVGDKPDLSVLRPIRNDFCAQRYWIPRQTGKIKSVTGLNEIATMPGVKMFESFFPPSGTEVHKATNHAERFAQVICTGSSLKDAIQNCKNAINSIQVEIN